MRSKLLCLLTTAALTACGDGVATQKDGPAREPHPDSTSFEEIAATELVLTPYMTALHHNEAYTDVTGKTGLKRDFTYSTDRTLELRISSEKVNVTECKLPGGANPAYTLIRLDAQGTAVSEQAVYPDEPFVISAGDRVRLRVAQPNIADCHAIGVLFAVNYRDL